MLLYVKHYASSNSKIFLFTHSLTMNILRAVLTGIIVWALIFVEWSIIVFAPVLKDLGNWQWIIHFIALILIAIVGLSFYYKGSVKTNGLLVGLIMLATGIVLDAIVTLPFFVSPQGITYAEFFLNPLMIVGFAELLLVSWLYWKKKVMK